MSGPPRTATPAPGDWFGQPRGLTILFLTETWVQFSFYGMRALLVLYMTKHLLIPQQKASWIYGLYAAMVYLTPLAGGILADRWLGRRKAVIFGSIIMAAGHLMMGFENLLYAALATIVIGNGLFLPALPSQIDSLYAVEDPRRSGAYNVYYVGINLGAFAAPLAVGTVGELYGFHWGFGLAAIGMMIGLATYLGGAGYLPPERGIADRATQRAAGPTPSALLARFALLAAIAGAVVVFRGAYEQLGNTIALWADSGVDRTVGAGLVIPVTWFQSLNPLIVFLLSPVLILFWARAASQGREPSAVVKMTAGAIVVGVSYLSVAAISALAQRDGGLVGWPLMAAFVVTMTIGELLILPVGLSLFGRLAPRGLSSTTIALWYSAGFLGNLFAGWVGTFWTSVGHGPFFAGVGGVAFAASAILALLIRRARRMELAG